MAKKKIIRTEEEIAELRAKRAEKKAKQTPEKEVSIYFPNNEATKDFLTELQRKIRKFRKEAVEKGITKKPLKDDLKIPFYLALSKLDYDAYRPELGALLIEGLKLQDREIKVACYHYLDKLFTEKKGVDFGWVAQMLNKRYVSRYGWALLRKHAVPGSLLVLYGGDILGDQLDEWAQDPKTQTDWLRLASEDGKPVDMRELLHRHIGVNP